MMQVAVEPVESLRITVLMDNVNDGLMLDQGPAKRMGLAASGALPRVAAPTLETGEVADMLIAEHGFSALVSVAKDGREHHILFDAGVSPDGVAENMRRLDIVAKDVEAIVLSHGHFDHTTGIDGFARSVGRANLPVIIHPEFWTRRRIAIPGRDPLDLPSTSRSALVGAGFEIIEERQPSFLLDRSVLITGEVDRVTEFERGFPVQQALHDGEWVPDPLTLDDQALIVHVRDKGLVVLTGCGHAGIVNIVRYAQRLTGVERVHAVVGGFHLNGPLFEPIIPATCEALVELAPAWLVPAHCTGFRAHQALAAAFPEQYIPDSVGTRFEF